MFRKLLVPLDGSSLAESALPLACKLAGVGESEILLLRVPIPESMFVAAPEGLGGYGLVWPDQALERSREQSALYLETQMSRLTEQGFSVRRLVAEGDPASVIVDTAAREKADLIVMSTHGHSGMTRWILGSVTEKVLRSMPSPVIIVRGEALPARILITLDGSAHSEQALDPGLEVADRLGAEVVLLRAVHESEATMDDVARLESLERGLGWRMKQEPFDEARSYLSKSVAAVGRGPDGVKIVVTDEPAAQSICDYIQQHGVDLTVMATHGRTGLRRWIYGSVTEKVLRHGSCSMLIVPSHT